MWGRAQKVTVAVLVLGLILTALGWGLTLRDSSEAPGGSGVDGGSAAGLLQAEKDAEKAARDAAVRLTTYDYRTLSTDFDWVVTAGTPQFRERFAEVSGPTRAYVTEAKVRASGSVDASAATAKNPDEVTVLLFLDQVLSTDAGSERRLATPRVTMSMVKVDGRWLVDAIELRDLVEQ